MSGTATYLYCVVRTARRPSAARIPQGVPGAARATPVPLGREVWLVVSDVPLEVYGPEKLDAAVRDLEWVSSVAVGHEAVVEHFARASETGVIPMKLFTMFSSVERAVEDMRSRRAEIAGVLKRIAGCEEWGVRVTRLTSPAGAATGAAGPVTSGTAFLAAKKAARDSAHEAARSAARAADTAYETLAAVSRAARRRDDVPSATAVPPLLDAAFLVPARSRSRFHGAAKKLAETFAGAGVEMTLSGPWPAYNFIQPPERAR